MSEQVGQRRHRDLWKQPAGLHGFKRGVPGVGGLSVINTMLMAVTERVREIRLKKAVGARIGHIMREYVLEAVVIGAIGGTIGSGVDINLRAIARTLHQKR